jgi:lipopolysaccharide export system permease protein
VTKLDRHIFTRLLYAIAAVMTVIAVEQLFQHSRSVYPLLISGNLSFGQLLLLWLNLFPLIFYHSLPEIASIAIAIQIHRWIDNNELLTMRNAGMSCARVARPGIAAVVVCALFCAANSLCLMPASWTRVETIRAQPLRAIDPALVVPEVEYQVEPGLSIEYEHRLADGTMKDVIVFDTRDQDGFTLVWSSGGEFLRVGQRSLLQLEKGTAQTKHGEELRRVEFDTLAVPLTMGDVVSPTPRTPGYYEQGIGALLHPPGGVRADAHQPGAWLMEGHYRIVAPLQCLGNGLLVLGLMIPGYRHRVGRWCRLSIAVVSGVATAVLPIPLMPLIADHIQFVPCFYLLAAGPAALGIALLLIGDFPLKKPAHRGLSALRSIGGWAFGSYGFKAALKPAHSSDIP